MPNHAQPRGRRYPSPTLSTKRLLEAAGWTVDDAERRVSRTLTKDLFGIIDIVAVREHETLGVQCTTMANATARCRKILKAEHLPVLLSAGWRIEVWGWREIQVDGRKSWLPKYYPITLPTEGWT